MDSVAFSDGAKVFHHKHSWIVGLDVAALDFGALAELRRGGRLLQSGHVNYCASKCAHRCYKK